MKVKELIKELQECNQDADVSIVVGNEDDNTTDTFKFEIHAKDVEEYIELFVFDESEFDFDRRITDRFESEEEQFDKKYFLDEVSNTLKGLYQKLD